MHLDLGNRISFEALCRSIGVWGRGAAAGGGYVRFSVAGEGCCRL